MLVLIQARMNSKRLPKKVLHKINNQEILKHMFFRIKNCKNNVKLVVATSKKKSDNPIVNLCKKNRIKFFRGSLNNVASRLLSAANKFKSKYFIRICGDSPLIDPQIIDRMINISTSKSKRNYDLFSNRLDKSIPSGQRVEIIKTKSMQEAYKKFFKKGHYEHVTSYFYENKKKFKIFYTSFKRNKTKIKLSVDTVRDLNKVKKLVSKLGNNKIANLNYIEKIF